MNARTQKGFTMIEVMLFLAITGLLTVGVLVGSGAAIGQQRYRDSVNSFKGFIQDQYSQIANVVNSSPKNPECNRTSGVVTIDDSSQQSRGTSECLIMGKLLLIEPTKVTSRTVVGQPAATSATDDTTVLRNYGLTTALAPEEEEIDWGARIVRPKTTTGATTSVLIIRSPVSGSILTYALDGTRTPVSMVSDANMVQKDFCVDSGGGSGMTKRLAVRINAKASGPSAIEIPLEKDNICD